MINIYIDLSSITVPVKMTKAMTLQLQENVLSEISEIFIENWKLQANEKLNRTRNIYKRSIMNPVIEGNFSTIELVGALPNMIEEGATAFDIKKGMEKSLKKHNKENGGWFINVPFRWASTDAIADNEAFSAKMPLAVYEVAKELDESTEDTSGKIIYGGSLDKRDLPKKFQGYGVRKEIVSEGKIYGAYKHKSNLYEGMIKIQKTYEKATQSQYISFRRISDLSDPLSWIHPGLSAKHLAEEAINETDFDFITSQVVNNFINKII